MKVNGTKKIMPIMTRLSCKEVRGTDRKLKVHAALLHIAGVAGQMFSKRSQSQSLQRATKIENLLKRRYEENLY